MINMIFLQAQNILETLKYAQDNIQANTNLDRNSIESFAFETLAVHYKVAVDMDQWRGKKGEYWKLMLKEMHSGLDDEILDFILENSTLNSELKRSLDELLPKEKKQGKKPSTDGKEGEGEEEEEEVFDMVAEAGKEFGAGALAKWRKELKAAEKKLAGFEKTIEKAEGKVEKEEAKVETA